jgi:hypothetical protein
MTEIFNKLTVSKEKSSFKDLQGQLQRISIMNKDKIINSLAHKDFENNCSGLEEKLDVFVDYYKKNPDAGKFKRRLYRANNSMVNFKMLRLSNYSRLSCLNNSNNSKTSKFLSSTNNLMRSSSAKYSMNKQDTNYTSHQASRTTFFGDTTQQLTQVSPFDSSPYNLSKYKNLIPDSSDYEFRLSSKRLDVHSVLYKKEEKLRDLVESFKKINEPKIPKKYEPLFFDRKNAVTDQPINAKRGVKFVKYMTVKPKVSESTKRPKTTSYLLKMPKGEEALKIRQICHNSVKKAETQIKHLVKTNEKIHNMARNNLNIALKGKEPDIVKRIVYEETIEYKKRAHHAFVYSVEGYKWENKDRLFNIKYKINMQDYN